MNTFPISVDHLTRMPDNACCPISRCPHSVRLSLTGPSQQSWILRRITWAQEFEASLGNRGRPFFKEKEERMGRGRGGEGSREKDRGKMIAKGEGRQLTLTSVPYYASWAHSVVPSLDKWARGGILMKAKKKKSRWENQLMTFVSWFKNFSRIKQILSLRLKKQGASDPEEQSIPWKLPVKP